MKEMQGYVQCDVMLCNLRSRVQVLDLPVVGYFPVRVQEFLHVYRTRNLKERVGSVNVRYGEVFVSV